MRSRQLGMSPAKMAIAVAVTMEAIAGTGSMKNVTGTRSAVAMVAVRPGTAPTKSPNAAEARITHSTYGSNTSASASKSILLEQSPGERDAQRLVESEMDGHGADHGHRRRHAPRSAQDPDPGSEQRDAGDVKAQAVRSQDVEHEAADHGRDAERRAATEHPVGHYQPGPAPAQAGEDQQQPAGSEPNGDQARKPCRAEALARHGRKPLDVPEDRGRQRDERRAGERVVDLYLASPTAFSAVPILASESAMNFVVPAGSAHTTPKP